MKIQSRSVVGLWLMCLAFLSFATGCASTSAVREPDFSNPTRPACAELVRQRPSGPLAQLEVFMHLSDERCHREAIELGRWLRDTYRDRNYSVSAEAISIFVPEDTLSEYVLESYERVYLSLMIASSYLALDRRDEAAVELRRAYSESKAVIYNHGEDTVNLLLAASLWEKIGDRDEARPYWQKLADSSPAENPLRPFAIERVKAIDEKRLVGGPYRILRVGQFPEVDWEMNWQRSGGSYFRIFPKTALPSACVSKTGARLGVEGWVDKIARRYESDYHPLLHVKSWVRLPVGIAYGVTAFTTGLGLAVGGCVADGYAKLDGDLCKASVKSGGYIMAHSGDIADFTLKPDLRHWARLPIAIVLTRSTEPASEPCFASLSTESREVYFEL